MGKKRSRKMYTVIEDNPVRETGEQAQEEVERGQEKPTRTKGWQRDHGRFRRPAHAGVTIRF